MQLQLQDEIKDLTHERDCLMMELQQLKEAKSVLARSYAKTASHPNQMQKIQNLEQKNRHLQLMVKQQQQYTESILHRKYLCPSLIMPRTTNAETCALCVVYCYRNLATAAQ